MADASFFLLDPQGNIIERKDAKKVFLRDGYWDLQDVTILKDGNASKRDSDRLPTDLRPEFVQERLLGRRQSHFTICRRRLKLLDLSV